MVTCSSPERGGLKGNAGNRTRMWTIWGLKKCRFDSKDFGTVVVSTYAARVV